jgi:hypothetical protein
MRGCTSLVRTDVAPSRSSNESRRRRFAGFAMVPPPRPNPRQPSPYSTLRNESTTSWSARHQLAEVREPESTCRDDDWARVAGKGAKHASVGLVRARPGHHEVLGREVMKALWIVASLTGSRPRRSPSWPRRDQGRGRYRTAALPHRSAAHAVDEPRPGLDTGQSLSIVVEALLPRIAASRMRVAFTSTSGP